MPEKDNILDSWILVEHLSEGDIKKNDSSMLLLDEVPENDYHSYFTQLLQEAQQRKKISSTKGGFVIYWDIFNFKEVTETLQRWYNIPPSEEEIRYGEKFTLAIYFDRKLNFLSDMTFLTASGYIRIKNNRLTGVESQNPENNFYKFQNEFKEYETGLIQKLNQSFNESSDDPEKFNQAIIKLTEQFPLINTRAKLIRNIETDETNLHSFFISDLEKAKKITTNNLTSYLFGFEGNKINLDSKSDSANFNPAVFERILMPCNFPSGRFPGPTKFALSFMQQTAVNLSTGFDTGTIRSVNGPPGTGKTTLLKDIFAELIVNQAVIIANMNKHSIEGSEETYYFNKASIGELPDSITENEIIVASSNNGAVQNIVNELPLISQIDENLINELEEDDGYFRELSNKKLSIKWENDKNGKSNKVLVAEDTPEENKFWGIFSLEGGKSENMTNILTHLEHINNYLKEEYTSDTNVYSEFLKQYNNIQSLKDKMQHFSDGCSEYRNNCAQLSILKKQFNPELEAKEKAANEQCSKLETDIHILSTKSLSLEQQINELEKKRENIKADKQNLSILFTEMSSQKPRFFAGKAKKDAYNERLEEISRQYLSKMNEDKVCENEEQKLKASLKSFADNINIIRNKQNTISDELNKWIDSNKRKIDILEEKTRNFSKDFSDKSVKQLDMNLDYEDLQLSNPWYDEDFRILQSKLFIAALRVRKQFLFENQKNLQAAINIWQYQNKNSEKKRIIKAAWHWINFTIPIISSTFASFSRMCRNLDENTLGHLFVDEAGQALPQAAVGAIMRSRHVMVVGDPAQIKPVLTLNSGVLAMIAEHFGLNEKYLSDSASAQTLVDAASRFGFYKEQDRSEDSWIGIPLWVHRRCLYPMFTISNQISYNNMMVQGNKNYGKTGWFDVKGHADNKFVLKQAEFLKEKLKSMIAEHPEIIDKNEKDMVYVITPFSNVAYMLSQYLRDIGFTRYSKGKATNIGTIHTFQGKEAPIVFMVLGADNRSKGAAIWAVNEPNMMNVAATRAKKEFYVIGDKRLYQSLGSDVANSTISIINQYGKQFPDLVDNDAESFLSSE